MEFVLLIPEGKENAIKRSDLVKTCVDLGFVEGKDSDRQTRKLIQLARKDHVILNLSNGEGYYRPSVDDYEELVRYIKQEDSRAIKAFANVKKAKALLEDMKYGRLAYE